MHFCNQLVTILTVHSAISRTRLVKQKMTTLTMLKIIGFVDFLHENVSLLFHPSASNYRMYDIYIYIGFVMEIM